MSDLLKSTWAGSYVQRLWYIAAAAEVRQSPTFSGDRINSNLELGSAGQRAQTCQKTNVLSTVGIQKEGGRELLLRWGGACDITHESQVIDRLKCGATIFRHSLSQLLLPVLGEVWLYFHARFLQIEPFNS